MMLIRTAILISISGLLSFSNSRMFYCYVQQTYSPDKSLKLTAIPQSDVNSEKGYVFVTSQKDHKLKQCLEVKTFSRSLFVISNNGEIIIQIVDQGFGCWDIMDPSYISTMFVYRNGELTDTVHLWKFGFLNYSKDLKGKDFRTKKSFSLARPTIAVQGDTLALKTSKNDDNRFLFFDLKSGKFLESRHDNTSGYVNIPYRFEYKDVFSREKLIRKFSDKCENL